MINMTKALQGLGAVSDYDIITIGGNQFSVNQIIDKTLIAQGDVKVYTGAYDNAPVKYITKAGNPLGKVYSYLNPNPNIGNGIARSDSWLELQTGTNTFVFVRNESSLNTTALIDQGSLTVSQEVKQEQDAATKDADPIAYYFKKLAMPVLIGGGLIYAVVQLGKTFITNRKQSNA